MRVRRWVLLVVSRADALQLRRGQEEIRKLVEGRMNTWAERILADTSLNPGQIRNALIEQTKFVVTQYGDVAASMAAEWYDDIRATEGVGGNFRAVTAASPYDDDAVDGMVRRAVGPLFTQAPDVSAVMLTLATNAGKYVLGAARETVRRNTFRDPYASGWQRVARGGACKFCLMLVGRGGVYRKETAFFASHGDCNCAAVPSFDSHAPEVDVAIYRASVRTTGMSPAQKDRHNTAIREYIAANAVELRATA